jgi:hypothetical protein
MARIAFLTSASLIFLSCAALPACGQQDEAQAVLAQCSDPVPRDIDSCLERARVLEETNPTPEMQALVGKLIQAQVRASEPPPPPAGPVGDANHPSDDQGVSSYDVAPPDPPTSSDMGPLEPYQPPPPDNSQEDTPPDSQTAPADMAPPDPNAPPQTNQDAPSSPPPQAAGPGR